LKPITKEILSTGASLPGLDHWYATRPSPCCLHGLDEQLEHQRAVGVLVVRQVLAVHLRLERMHDHRRRHVVDPEVVAGAVAQRRHGVARQALRVRPGERAGGLQPVGPDQHLVCHLHVLLHGALVGLQVALVLAPALPGQQRQQRNHQ
jgi:hypothetical protein